MAIYGDNKKRMLNFQEDCYPLALLLVLAITFLYNGLFPLDGAQVLSSPSDDAKNFFYPVRYFGFASLQERVMPLWNPYIFAGTPFVGTLQTAVFYPFNFPFLIFSTHTAINWNIALHLFLSGSFTYYLLKHYGISRFGSTIAGIVYTFSAPQVMQIYAGHLNVLTAMVWTPLMFLFLDRVVRGDGWRYGIYLSLTIAFQLLAGQPQYLFYSMIALLFYLFFLLIRLRLDGTDWNKIWPKILLFAATVILGLALSAIQTLPTAEMTRYSTRENLSYEWVSIFSFPPENLITFLIPGFFGDMLKTPYWGKNYLWEVSAYVGIMPLVLAGVAALYIRNRVVWFFTGLSVVSVVLAFGKYTPLLKLLYTTVPGFNLFRGNSKFIFLNALSIAVLSGFGADVVRGFDDSKKRLRVFAIALIILTSIGLLISNSTVSDTFFRKTIDSIMSSGDLFENPEPMMRKGFELLAAASFRSGVMWTMALIASGMALLLLFSYGVLKKNIFMAVLAALIVVDLFSFGMRYMVIFDSKSAYWDSAVVRFLKQDKEPFRVVAPYMGVNGGMVAGLETLGGYDTIMVKRYSEFINLSQGASPDKPNLWVDINNTNKMTDLLNARYLVLPSAERYDNPAFRPVFDNGRNRIYQNMNAIPRAFVVHAAKVIADRDGIFRELMMPDFNPVSYAVIEEEPETPFIGPGVQSPIPRFIHSSPNEVKIEAYLTEAGLLILGDVYYPGWKAYVDGAEKKIHPVNYVMRGVYLPAGRHIVEFRYKPLFFKIGAAISLSTLIFMAGFLIWDWRR